MPRMLILSLALVGLGACGAKEKPEESLSSAEPRQAAPSTLDKELGAQILGAMKAGFERHDLQGYLSIWTQDSQLIRARGPAAGDLDQALSYQQNAAGKALRFALPAPEELVMEMSDIQIATVEGDKELRWIVHTSMGVGSETVGELYKLRASPEGWRVYENRWWLIETTDGSGHTTTYDAAYWAQRDAELALARGQDDKERLVQAYLAAGLPLDAHAEIAQWTAESRDSALWARRAESALAAGDGLDARRAACQARALDAATELGVWARSLSCDAEDKASASSGPEASN